MAKKAKTTKGKPAKKNKSMVGLLMSVLELPPVPVKVPTEKEIEEMYARMAEERFTSPTEMMHEERELEEMLPEA